MPMLACLRYVEAVDDLEVGSWESVVECQCHRATYINWREEVRGPGTDLKFSFGPRHPGRGRILPWVMLIGKGNSWVAI